MNSILYLKSLRQTVVLDNEAIIRNLQRLFGVDKDFDVMTYQTINNVFEKLDPDEVIKVISELVKGLMKKECFQESRIGGFWQLVVDATDYFSVTLKPNEKPPSEGCLTAEHKNAEGVVTSITYTHKVLECKLILSEQVAISICSVFIENTDINDPNNSEQKKKQDCEIKAFYRLEKKLKELYGDTKFLINADSLYACQQVFKICEDNHWTYSIRFKEGSIPSLAKVMNLEFRPDTLNSS
jgi:hypothetical protein